MLPASSPGVEKEGPTRLFERGLGYTEIHDENHHA